MALSVSGKHACARTVTRVRVAQAWYLACLCDIAGERQWQRDWRSPVRTAPAVCSQVQRTAATGGGSRAHSLELKDIPGLCPEHTGHRTWGSYLSTQREFLSLR